MKRYFNLLWWILCLRPLDWLAGLARKSAVANSVLVTYPNRIGDFILFLDAARGLRELYPAPSFKLTLLADPAFASLAAQQGHFDAVCEINRTRYFSSPLYRFHLNRRIASAGFTTVLNPGPWPDQYHVDSVIGVSGGRERIGWEVKDTSGSKGAKLMRLWRASQYTRLITQPSEKMGILRFNALFLRALGHECFLPQLPSLKLPPTCSPAIPRDPFYVLCPGAADSMKRWPVENFARIAEAIFTGTGMRGVVCGTRSEGVLARELCEMSHAPLVNLAGALDVQELSSLLAHAKLVICNDSAPIHIAAAVNTPSVCVVGGGTFGWCVPYDLPAPEGSSVPRAIYHRMGCFGCGWHCIYRVSSGQPAPCLINISVQDATGAALTLLNSKGPFAL